MGKGEWATSSGKSIDHGFKSLARTGRDTSRRGLEATAVLFTGELIQTLSTPGRGKWRRPPAHVRKRLKSRRAATRARGVAFQEANRASLPGDPPAPDFGVLRGSAGYEILERGFKARVGVRAKYGAHLEFGTPKMAARPFLRPTYARLVKAIRGRGVAGKLFKGRP